MTATLITTTTSPETHASSNRGVRRAGVTAGLTAAATTTGVAAAADAIGVSIKVGGEAIPMAGFAQLTLFFTAVGVVIASVMNRRARHARQTFVSTTLALTALSFVPDVLVDAPTATKLTLVLTHVVAAAIVIPTLAGRLSD